uniref:Integral membrane protein n=1 Tax=Streptomyces sp. NBC_00003 TaxID=2903608 RepID=A0AAU2V5S3_9ACTN
MSFDDEPGHGGGDPGHGDDRFSTLGGTRQTRTRLPAGTGDIYGGARRPARNNRSLVMVVGVVVLLVAAIAFANRGGDSGSSSDGQSAKKPEAQSTAATGTKPVDGKQAGIASGFPQTEQGAQSAAANYAVALGSEGMFKSSTRGDIVRATHDPSVVGGLLGQLDQAYTPSFFKNVGLNDDGSTPSGLTFVSRTVPVGTKVTQQDGASASVEVWCTGLVGLAGAGSTKPVTQTWFTITEKLKWVGGDWKIESSSQTEGPTPVSGDNRASTADEIAKAVQGYGGFTYAR